MNNKFWLTAVAIISLAGLSYAAYDAFVAPRDKLACTTEFHLYRNQGKASEVRVNTIAQFWFHNDGTGMTTYKGAATAAERNLIIDRDVTFTWQNSQDDGGIDLIYVRTWRRHNDNTPDVIWGSFAKPGVRYYLTLEEMKPGTWLMTDRIYPTYLCRTD